MLAIALSATVPALAAHPKKGAGWGDRGDSTTSQGDSGMIRFATNPSGKVFDFAFSYGCKTDQPTVDVSRTTRSYLKNKKHPALKVSKRGRFKFSGQVKTFDGVSSFDGDGPFKNATIDLRGHFTSKTKAVGSFTLSEPGCETGKVTWTANAH